MTMVSLPIKSTGLTYTIAQVIPANPATFSAVTIVYTAKVGVV